MIGNNFNYVLGRNIKRMIYPLYLTQIILLSSKYVIDGNFVKPIKVKFHILVYSIIIAIVIYSICSYVFSYNSNHDVNSSKKMISLYYLIVNLFYCFNLLIICSLNMVYSRDHIRLLMKIQQIQCKLSLNEKDVSNFIARNWVIVSVLVLVNTLISFEYYYTLKLVDIVLYFLDYLITGLDINMIYANFIIVLLKKYLIKWNNVIMCISNKQVDKTFCEEMFITYEKIFATYNLLNKVFKILVSNKNIANYFKDLLSIFNSFFLCHRYSYNHLMYCSNLYFICKYSWNGI